MNFSTKYMEIKRFVSNPIGENCYIISDGTEGAIIDCGFFDKNEWQKAKEYLEDTGIKLKYALQTHMHFDHVWGLSFLEKEYGLRPLCHQQDQEVYDKVEEMVSDMLGTKMPVALPPVGGYLKDGELLPLGNCTIEVIHTPGHTPGGICFYMESEKQLFCGDTLFQGSIGRTDFPGGSMIIEIESIRERILTLPDDTTLHPGHGPHSTVSYEKRYNMYVR